mmetsp:Transcript_51970/g.161652  ORF Transcript_51970/g.161652 Transcript_51970/m.161652 type:complete len:92 (+) Transcript_51970:1931-2206(+)
MAHLHRQPRRHRGTGAPGAAGGPDGGERLYQGSLAQSFASSDRVRRENGKGMQQGGRYGEGAKRKDGSSRGQISWLVQEPSLSLFMERIDG